MNRFATDVKLIRKSRKEKKMKIYNTLTRKKEDNVYTRSDRLYFCNTLQIFHDKHIRFPASAKGFICWMPYLLFFQTNSKRMYQGRNIIRHNSHALQQFSPLHSVLINKRFHQLPPSSPSFFPFLFSFISTNKNYIISCYI